MYRLQDWAAVQRVYKQTGSKRETARVLEISRNTVKKLLELAEEPEYRRTIYKSCLDRCKELIIEWRYKPNEFNGTRIFRELKKKGIPEASALFTGFSSGLMKILGESVQRLLSGLKPRRATRLSLTGQNTPW